MSTPYIRAGNKVQIVSVSAGLDIPQSQDKPEGKKTFGQCIVDLKNSGHESISLMQIGGVVGVGAVAFAAGSFYLPLLAPIAGSLGIISVGTLVIGAGWLVCAALKKYCSKDNRHQSTPTPTPNGVEGYDNQALDSGDADATGGGSGGERLAVADNGEISDMSIGQANLAFKSDEDEDPDPDPSASKSTRKPSLNLQNVTKVKGDSEVEETIESTLAPKLFTLS